MDSRDLSSNCRDGDENNNNINNNNNNSIFVTGNEASMLFESRRYSECIDKLHHLLLLKKDDPKVLHNIVVAEYFKDGCSDPRKVLEVLNKVKKTSEDLARSSDEQTETPSNHGNSISGSKGSGTALHQLSASNSSIPYIDEFDTSVTTLNIAVVLFHLHEYASALSILEPLFQNLEPIEETTALHICLLLLDVALASQNAKKVMEVLQYLERTFGLGHLIAQGDNGSTVQPHYSHLPVKSSSLPSNSTSLDISTSDSVLSAPENPLVRTLSDENYENLLSTLDSGAQNHVRPPGLLSNDLSKPSLDRSVPALDLKFKLHLYKIRLLILTRNLKAAKREVKNFMNIGRGRDSSIALLLKSHLEYARGNYRKSIKLLMTSNNRTEPGMSCIINNNLGCIYHQLKKHHASTVLFSKGLKSTSEFRSEKPLKLLSFSQDKFHLMVYNCGLQYLISGKPIIAARCFQKAGLVFYDRPLLWLRIAECCLLALEKGLLEPILDPKHEEVIVHVAGKGAWRQLHVTDESKVRHLESTEDNNGDQQKLSISFGRQCLLNALHLLERLELKLRPKLKSPEGVLPLAVEEDGSNGRSAKDSNHKNMSAVDSKAVGASQASANGDAKDSKAGGNLTATLQISVSAYEEVCRAENLLMKQAVLADLAYLELTLDNPLKALSAAKSLLTLPGCSRIYTFFGNIYAAEALCRLNRANEAATHLSHYLSEGMTASCPYSEDDAEKWRGKKVVVDGEEPSGGGEPVEESQGIVLLKPAEARGALFVSFACLYGMQGNVELAHQLASKAHSLVPNSRQAILTAAYFDLLLGKSQDALAKLKNCSRVRFLSATGLTLRSSS